MTRVAYPWKMVKTTTSFGTTVWRPADKAVDQEMQFDFLTYWTWSGHEKPAVVVHFVPDEAQIARLATPAEAGQLQAYVQQVQSSGQLVTYQGPQLIQNVKTCTQDGLRCTNLYAFGATTKTVYDTNDGSVISQTASPDFFATVSIVQVYNQELKQWQVAQVAINEVAG
jgi:hypothetical protein